jgi:hypothetical protein
VIKIFKKRYVIATLYFPKMHVMDFYTTSYDFRKVDKINFAKRFTLVEIIKRISQIREERWDVFRITRTGKLKKFI